VRFLSVVGARPQFIKAAPLGVELRRRHEEFLVHTGQHYDDNMSDIFFEELSIPAPWRHLGVGSGPHGRQTGMMLERIEQVLEEVRPGAVIVYGDTNSTLAGALAAAKLNLPVAHVEAGLRSFNRRMPEEINRVVTDHLARWLFVPSQTSARQLAAEGIVEGVYDVGDIMADALRLFAPLAARRSRILQRLALRPRQYAVATVHRAANTDDPQRLRNVLEGLRQVPYPVILPLHPRTRAAACRHGLQQKLDPPECLAGGSRGGRSPRGPTGGLGPGRVVAIEPLGYLDMLQLQQHAAVVLTDSGGVQKEAYWLGVPCVTLREETEWVETVASGWNRLAGVDPGQIAAAVRHYREGRPTERPALYGDGHAAARIAEILGGDAPASA
jgi:UDP-N-acetylglucosamine 2-epimerase